MSRLTKKQEQAIRPFLPALIKRFEQAGKTGVSKTWCSLCKAAIKAMPKAANSDGANHCYWCPVFSDADCDLFVSGMPWNVGTGLRVLEAPDQECRDWCLALAEKLRQLQARLDKQP